MPNSQDPVAAVHVSKLKKAFTVQKKLHADVYVAGLQPSADITEGEAACPATNQYGLEYRDYKEGGKVVRPCVIENYSMNHKNQTYDFVGKMQEHWGKYDKMQLGVWEAIELLNEVVDDSDPDTALPQIEHLLQTAEACRKAFPEDDWMHLVGLLHDLGKVLAHPAFGSQPQWAVVGDTFPTGITPEPCVVYHELFDGNPDLQDPRFQGPCGAYSAGCGLDNVRMSWGHDEYGYRVLKHNGTTLPPAALFIIRYHSFYALHQHKAYAQLLDEQDRQMLPWLVAFQKCDLYSKTEKLLDVQELKPYYMGLINKYCPKYVMDW